MQNRRPFNRLNLFCLLYLPYLLIAASSCSTITSAISGKKTPHEQYEKKIKDAGLNKTSVGDEWLKAAAVTLSNPLDITLPYTESGYFIANGDNAVGLRFRAKKGQKVDIRLIKKPGMNLTVYMDLWKPFLPSTDKKPELLFAADTSSLSIEFPVIDDTIFIVRVQPELLKQGGYSLNITSGPSLSFPVSPKVKSSIISYYGDGRDNGGRKHEGIDILAPKHSPAVAAANGIVTRVEENSLGGKVVYLRPDNASYSLYYAHLDSQLVEPGQRLKTGDVLGLTGNTGNAKNTVSHLHFGIYANNVAMDPLYFVKASDKEPQKLSVETANINTKMRAVKNARLYTDQNLSSANFIMLDDNTMLTPEAATGNTYRVILPDGKKGYIAGNAVATLIKPIKRLSIKKALALLSAPDYGGLHKKMLVAGDKINVLASFKDFYFVSEDQVEGWVAKNEL